MKVKGMMAAVAAFLQSLAGVELRQSVQDKDTLSAGGDEQLSNVQMEANLDSMDFGGRLLAPQAPKDKQARLGVARDEVRRGLRFLPLGAHVAKQVVAGDKIRIAKDRILD